MQAQMMRAKTMQAQTRTSTRDFLLHSITLLVQQMQVNGMLNGMLLLDLLVVFHLLELQQLILLLVKQL